MTYRYRRRRPDDCCQGQRPDSH